MRLNAVVPIAYPFEPAIHLGSPRPRDTLLQVLRWDTFEGGVYAIAEATPETSLRLSGHPTEARGRYAVVTKTVDDKLSAERRRNKFNDMVGGHVMS